MGWPMAGNRALRPRHVDFVDLSGLIAAATERLHAFAAKTSQPLIAFSGGKDSIVAAHLARQAIGCASAVCEVSFAFRRDVLDYQRLARELGLDCRFTDSLDMDWLRANPHLLFADLTNQGELYARRQQSAVRRHANKFAFDGVIFGRRREENSVRAPLYQTSDGRWQCHPIMDWKTAHVWQYIEQHGLGYPGIYDTPIGQLEGADPWIGVSMSNAARRGWNGYDLIWDYDPTPLFQIASWHEPTRRYLMSRGDA
jgi:3'-phosphoadenosine 5'-phosphosulfate sulfotransferase (PAPS reductase)/FAD synthetase